LLSHGRGAHPLENWDFPCNKFVISTGAQRSGEICGFFLHTLFSPHHPLQLWHG
jgi:hypothetical protein